MQKSDKKKPSAFDNIASTYDESFTRTSIGTLQRKAVWRYLENIVPQLPGIEIMELNCGTGEDAVLFSEKGFNIVATDISTEMLKVTEKKVAQFSMPHKVHVRYFDMEDFDVTLFNKKFDLVFSNFGGINCLSPSSLKYFLTKIPGMLNPGGRFIAVIMPKNCLWESLYFLFKLQPSKAFRRWTNKAVAVNVNGTSIDTWYYNPGTIKNWMKGNYQMVDCWPIGLTLPPSYLQNYFDSHNRTLMRLNALEIKLSSISWLASFADHFIIDIKSL